MAAVEKRSLSDDIEASPAKVQKYDATSTLPSTKLKARANELGLSFTGLEFAKRMDDDDPLQHFRNKFIYPLNEDLPSFDPSLIRGDDECVYLCGNSLGLQPKEAKQCVNRELDKWGKIGLHGHFKGEMPWAFADECVDELSAKVVGAKREEVAIMNGLTVNLHLLLVSFYRPTAKRHKVLLESRAFPSDHYAIESQIRLHGYDPATSMVCLEPREGEHILRTEDILARIASEGDEIACVLFSGIQYYTGQVFDMPAITKAGHEKGCYVGFDLAHAVGNIELQLHDWDVDFACWCTYKYLNTGAGGIAGAFIHKKHAKNDFPKLSGWWGHKMDTRFNMDNNMDLANGAHGYRISNPPPLLCATLEASLKVFNETSMSALREKSKLLTAYLEMLLDEHYPRPTPANPHSRPYAEVISPRDPDQRGCQLSIMFSVSLKNVYTELEKRGVVCDVRKPYVIRIAPAPLYNSFKDVHRFVQLLGDSLVAAHVNSTTEGV